MTSRNLDTILIYSTLGIFLLVYLFTFPTGWLISDEYSYFNQGLALAQGNFNLAYHDAVLNESIAYNRTSYPLGNAFWIALWISVFGSKYAYLGSIVCVLLSSYFLLKILEKNGYQKLSVLLLFLYPSLAFFCKSLMSSIPSLLIVSAFTYSLFTSKDSGKKWFYLSFLAALSFWFRETNLILLGGIALIHFFLVQKWFFHYALGAMIGFLPRLWSAYYFYDDALFWVLAEQFSLLNILNNALVYAIILGVFMPLGLLFLLRFRGKYYKPIIAASLLYIFAYLSYGFNATTYSGTYKGVILMGRFMIPLLPLFIISVGWYFREHKISKWMAYSAFALICAVMITMQIFIHKEAQLHKATSNLIYEKYQDKMVLYDLSRRTNIIRYLNPFHGELNYSGDVARLSDKNYMRNLFTKFDEAYVIQSVNTGNQKKKQLTSSVSELVKSSKQYYYTETVDSIPVKPALHIKVIRISPKNE